MDAIANARWRHSPLRSILAKNGKHLGKRDMSNMAMASAFAVPSVVTAAQGVWNKNNNETAKRNAFFTGVYDVTSTLLMFSGFAPGMILGSVMMLSKSLFAEKSPPSLDPTNLFKDITTTIRMMLPSPDQTFMQMKSLLGEMMDNKIDMKFQRQYELQNQRSLGIITLYLNQFQYNQSHTQILQKYETMVLETSKEMMNNKLPLNVDDALEFEYYEIGAAVAIYPQFVSMLLMALKEWYLLAKRLNQPTQDISNSYYKYIKAFLIQYPKMINAWYESWRAYILTSTIKKSESNMCLLNFKVPNMVNNQGYVQEKAELKYAFIPENARRVAKILDKDCGTDECKYVTLLSDDANTVCKYERTYKKECSKPCSKTRQVLSWSFVPFGLTKGECFKNKPQCEYTQTGLQKIKNSCVRSKCSNMLMTAVNAQIKQLETNVKQVRQTVVKFNSFLEKANINDTTVLQQQLLKVDSVALQQVVQKDEVFSGDVCPGFLYIPQNKQLPKQCIVKTAELYACPTIFNKLQQYILYPDVIRSQIGKYCPNYIKPVSKQQTEKILGKTLNEEQLKMLQSQKLENITN